MKWKIPSALLELCRERQHKITTQPLLAGPSHLFFPCSAAYSRVTDSLFVVAPTPTQDRFYDHRVSFCLLFHRGQLKVLMTNACCLFAISQQSVQWFCPPAAALLCHWTLLTYHKCVRFSDILIQVPLGELKWGQSLIVQSADLTPTAGLQHLSRQREREEISTDEDGKMRKKGDWERYWNVQCVVLPMVQYEQMSLYLDAFSCRAFANKVI